MKDELFMPSHPFLLNNVEIKHNFIKRTFDILFSLSAMILCLPLFFIIGLLIKLTSRGCIIYSHERIGRGGIFFRCYKFRTMYEDADIRLQKILASNAQLKQEWDCYQKLKKDPRITSIGNFLRKYSFDEFPQFWNVLKGDLSIVGPRPVVLTELERHFGMKAPRILSVRPGLTGLWQVSGRSNTSYQERIRLDEEYINKRSFYWI